MKKLTGILTLMAMAFVMFAVSSCSADQQLDREIKAYKAQLPMYVGEGMTISDIENDGSYLVYTADYNESGFEIPAIKDYPEVTDVMKQAIAQELFSSNNAEVKKLFELLREANLGVKYKIVGERTGDTLELVFEPDEI